MSFSYLSPEIRWQIWELIDDPRTVELFVKNSPLRRYKLGQYSRIRFHQGSKSEIPQIMVARNSIPLVLKICQESRRYGLEIYHKLKHGVSFAGYFDFSADTLFIPPSIFPCLGYFKRRIAFPFLAFDQLQHLAVYFPTSPDYPLTTPTGIQKPESAIALYQMSQTLRQLRTITYFSAEPVTTTFREQFMGKWAPPWPVIEFATLDRSIHDDPVERCLHMKNIHLCRFCFLPVGQRDIDPLILYRLGN